jgi:hypothetical protein
VEETLAMGPVAAGSGAGGHRVEVDIGGERLWFESSDAVLDGGAEAAAGAVLLPAAAAGKRLEIADPVSPEWMANVARMMEIWREWWGYPPLPPRTAARPPAGARAGGTALCFTGGVDSFHTLLCGPARPDILAFVHGYDIPLTDRPRMAAWERSLREVAAEVGARAVVLRSNLRRHPLSAAGEWDRSHGGALAAAGHLLAGQAGTLLVSSSFPAGYPYKWGSHSRLDPLWSSDRLAVVHWGETRSRVGKVREIAGHELARRHLRVCWENRAAAPNCSRCDKCLCTMALIAAAGADGRFPVFDWSGSLAGRIDRLPRTRFVFTYRELLESGPERKLARAVRSLLERTAGRPTLLERIRRRVKLLR